MQTDMDPTLSARQPPGAIARADPL